MSLINSFTVQSKTGDINISDSSASLTFHFQEKTTLVEGRGSTFADNLNSGGTTYKDATPFSRAVFDNWIGGGGQQAYNKTFGGTGAGGDDTRYLDADAYTLRTGYLLPGMARNLVYNTVAGQPTPISSGVDPLAGDEYEVPRGVLGFYLYGSGSVASDSFTASASATVTNLRVLLYFGNVPASNFVLTATLTAGGGGGTSTYAVTVTPANILNHTGWKWYTLAKTGGTGSIVSGNTNSIALTATTLPSGLIAAVGGYVQNTAGGAKNQCLAYFQLMTSATPFKYWGSSILKMEQVLNGTTYVNMALTGGSLFNTAATGTTGSVATSPERLWAGAGGYVGSIVFNNNLYVSASNAGVNNTYMWTPAAAAANNGATSSNSVYLGSPVSWAGQLYFVNSDNSIWKYDGAFPGTSSALILGDSIGQKGTAINALFVLGGFLHVIKPEGIFQLYQQPDKIDTTETPQINKVVAFPSVHPDTGKWWVVHQEMLFCNYRDVVYQCAFNSASGTQISVLKPEIPRYRLNYYHYVNGLSSDGRNVYASWNNLGVYALSGQSWHKLCEFYETVSVEGQASGLRWLPNPTAAPDYLFCGDGRTLLQIPVPNAYTGISNQIFANHTNKCGYLFTSLWDGDVAEIMKYVHAVTIRAKANDFRIKMVPLALASGDTATDAMLFEKSFCEGLFRDSWLNWTAITSQPAGVALTKVDAAGNAVANTLAPAFWSSGDFNNVFYSVEKNAFQTTDTTSTPPATALLSNPSKFVQTAFLIYYWMPTAGMQSTTGQEILAVDSIALKYLPILDYIPTYQCTVDFSSIIDENLSLDTNTTLGTYVAQLRAWSGRHSPVTIQFWDGYSTSNGVLGIKTVNVLLRDVRFEYDPATTQAEGSDPIPKRAFLSMIGIDAEYQGS